jgi:hypothetical protein
MSSGSNDVVVTWTSVSNRVYRVEYKTNLTDTNWIGLSPEVVATGSTASLSDAVYASRLFYRVVLLP